MDRDQPGRKAGFNSRHLRASERIGSRPDRLAFWAVVMSLVVLVVAAGTARAGSGGPGTGGAAPDPADASEAVATIFGPGLYGNEMACGERLTRTVVGVAHRTLPCGTKVSFRHGGRSLKTTVVDRGPYAKGVEWDLTSAAATKLGLTYTDTVRVTVGR